ncbi:hypothetical protein BV372_12360 [Nostoc sp. T09]|uniref:hypothetical protein n=1 Tax=Nostoc sp. T09 TaxID=1932621 RepID=UPI000A3D0317|nr:hypothetical protein [Nostoc sp. T09]OUL35137.1 hypothetical protein BV372_12360 [Nostoc sp. T09]
MKVASLINSAFLVTSIALLPGISGAQTDAKNINEPVSINSNNLSNHSTNISYLKPFNVVFLAYQGNLKEQGIPSGSTLVSQYQTRNLTALDVVKAAVKAHKIPSQVLNDQSYLYAVELQLQSFNNNFSE